MFFYLLNVWLLWDQKGPDSWSARHLVCASVRQSKLCHILWNIFTWNKVPMTRQKVDERATKPLSCQSIHLLWQHIKTQCQLKVIFSALASKKPTVHIFFLPFCKGFLKMFNGQQDWRLKTEAETEVMRLEAHAVPVQLVSYPSLCETHSRYWGLGWHI